MALLEVVTGVLLIVDAFTVGDIFLSLRIKPALIISAFSTQHCICHAQFLSCFSTQHCTYTTLYKYISPVLVHGTVYHPRLSSPVSVHNTVYNTRYIFLLFNNETLNIIHVLVLSFFSKQHCILPKLYFSPVLEHKTVYHPRYISLLFQYTTLYITYALFLSCFCTQHCKSHTIYFSPV